jgi:perosamine synthetase
MSVNFFSTTINKTLNKEILRLFKNGFISSGKKSDKFEEKFKNFFNLKYCTAVNSGTSALHLSLKCIGITQGDEVILPPQTFIATGLAILYCGATPIFADIQPSTGNICPLSVRDKITKRTKAVIAVDWGGYPCDLDELKRICKKKIIIIQDAAHSIGSIYKGRVIGQIADFTCFSFQAKKHLTTGDGGMLVCKKKKYHILAQKLKWFGIDRKNKKEYLGERMYNLTTIGYKYHMNDIAALMGIENLKIINLKIKKLRLIARTYDKELKNIKGIKLLERDKSKKSSYWLYTILINNRSKFFNLMKKYKIQTSLVHRRIDRHKIFGGIDYSLKGQNIFNKKHICLPIHENVKIKDVKKIKKILVKYL